MMKYVKVMTIPGRSTQVEVDYNATVADCVSITCTAPATGANANTVPKDGADIVLTRQVKGA
jgi:hypothetical protein